MFECFGIIIFLIFNLCGTKLINYFNQQDYFTKYLKLIAENTIPKSQDIFSLTLIPFHFVAQPSHFSYFCATFQFNCTTHSIKWKKLLFSILVLKPPS